MSDAGGTNTFEILANVGERMLCKVRNTSVDSTETIPLDGMSNSVISAGDTVILLGALNETTETQLAGTAIGIEYSKSAMHFTITESGITDEVYTIMFYLIKK